MLNKYDNVMMETALIFSKESYATRLKVGAVLAKEGRILLTGYNGTIAKTNNVCELTCDECNGNKQIQISNLEFESCNKCQGKGLITSPYLLHAEQNIISWAARKGISTENATLYITHNPCKECAKLIAQAGISRVVFKEFYRDQDGVKFLEGLNIVVDKI